jgi:hypothetical protein
MKYLIWAILAFGAYNLFLSDIVRDTDIPILDKIQTGAVEKQEVIDAVLPNLYDACSDLSKKSRIEECNYAMNYNEKFCIETFNSRTSALIKSEDVLLDKMQSLTNCMMNSDVF